MEKILRDQKPQQRGMAGLAQAAGHVVRKVPYRAIAVGLGLIATAIGCSILLFTVSGRQVVVEPGTQSVISLPDLLNGRSAASEVAAISRDKDYRYQVKNGETLSEIAQRFGLQYSMLALYNNLIDPDSIRAGDVILIPSSVAEARLREEVRRPAAFRDTPRTASRTAPSQQAQRLVINVDKRLDGGSVTAHFSVSSPSRADLTDLVWDLGNGRRERAPQASFSYNRAGTYTVYLTARDQSGRRVVSNKIFIDVPHPSSFRDVRQRFVTLGQPGDTFSVEGSISRVANFGSLEDAPFVLVESNGGLSTYKATKEGYFAITTDNEGAEGLVYLFVSPIPSRHSDRADLNWYRTQFNTGTPSNCGPSVVSMGIGWSLGEYVPVSEVRQTIGWQGDGGTSFEELKKVFEANGVRSKYTRITSMKDIYAIIDRGNIAVVLFNTGAIPSVEGRADRSLFGRYYADEVGHYAIIKGYSLDGQYAVVYDPIPSDWGANSLRYSDGISMIGRNRYFPAKDLFSSIRRFEVLEIQR